ncbi:putative short-chain dehydrogenase/reductase SDR [Streptomyces sp. Tu6071]|uniref:SDR family NAD(P)-dependent oxidoreductase n=1 Tax=Streptomyces evansiae TaxID=3075535 RepID=A0ABD5E2R7_9ACTN|nr:MULTISPECIES: SDR family NAD(P)-dependent oxidoreductase [unclassified Streptomyces]ASY31459.1 short-chain dehydrogenase [Streptomyces sp. CLI2509]EGJ73023.1 putative short-chain dehydrogenase/reductase SDR [Streptomyces sp. Tu6071]MDT0415087.1 SDR family NAD(P)-dependent oxidoreductase [Streptomyces sp. DSM 41982]MYX19910.1 SDR family NAD(P)-dependent oxidoreductase [Streptomyces sp. SID8380]SCE05253.1 NAD(P)-dependent dehydrogenase, short-chain alcohol dehydrogenase family [Streptomyces s
MTGISFEGRVAIVTGAGGGLGRAHALDLAARGAKLVVNDLGGSIAGTGGGSAMADEVVAEIVAAGGEAVANYDSVATPEGGAAIVRSAVDAFGTVDILVNNAGNIRNAPFTDLKPEAIEALLAVHVKGAFYVTQPAFAVMREKGYGRIVFTASAAGVFGSPEQANYAAAKNAVLGISNVVALEGAPHGITSNTILPVSDSRMIADMNPETLAGVPKTPAHREPEMITAMVSYLASEANPYTHEAFSIARGRYGRVFTGVTEGYTVPFEAPVATADDIAAHIDEIRDRAVYHVPGSMVEEFSLVP